MNLEQLKNNSAARYLTVGSFTFLCEYLVFYALYVFLDWNLLLANSLSFAVGLSVSFALNRTWAFKKEEFHKKAHHQAVIYVALAITNLLINNLIVGGLKAGGVDPRIGKIVAIGVIAIWNFILFKTVIFSEKK